MITPLDYKTPCVSPVVSLAFPSHAGGRMDLYRATSSEYTCCNCVTYYCAPKAEWRVGSDSGYHDEDDGSFNVPFGVVLDRPNRRCSP